MNKFEISIDVLGRRPDYLKGWKRTREAIVRKACSNQEPMLTEILRQSPCEIVGGILPVRLLENKPNDVRLVSFPSSAGIGPDNELFEKSNSSKLITVNDSGVALDGNSVLGP
ncbi:uncharacterized protein A4U43_C04F20000 [Asparagus officinalis]|uniref:Uncharacterized protein n=1 Tax=Asparagus officinalis TaxID=4686 RepID=A0A5P1F437_ASPOF|nr:uncharacterized protein A4U43_C04F20000 [Asparagus officinalis]